jgi:hydrogenase maturation protease
LDEILIYGIGNPARQDDALGIIMIDKLEKWAYDNSIIHISFDSNYQLNIEEAATISEKKLIIFVDASHNPIESFTINKIMPEYHSGISSHHVSPETLLKLSQEIFSKSPSVYLLQIKGYRWVLNKPVTTKALKNLNVAFQYLTNVIRNSETIQEIEKKISVMEANFL